MTLRITHIAEWNLFSNCAKPYIIAGPCSAESREQLLTTAQQLKSDGIEVLRAGIWKPRTRPGSFEGVGEIGLEWMQEAREQFGLKIATEVANASHLEAALKAGMDLVWIGARTTASPFTMQEIADALKGVDIPVLVKNPVNPDVDLWYGALERLNGAGVTKLGAIHRGFSAYGEMVYRNQPQWELAIELHRRCPEIPMFCDPSHIAGKREYLFELSQKAMNLGFDGLMIESHCNPQVALSDAPQQLTPSDLNAMVGMLSVPECDSDNPDFIRSIEELRARVDQVDEELLDLLEERMNLVEEIGKCKQRCNISILQAKRWDTILNRVLVQGKKRGLEQDMLKKIYQLIHQASIDRQNGLKL
ncbi:MAG: chorismate mutase [Marinifilaceae bacterium]